MAKQPSNYARLIRSIGETAEQLRDDCNALWDIEHNGERGDAEELAETVTESLQELLSMIPALAKYTHHDTLAALLGGE